MLHCSWDMVHDTCNYFSFWATFCLFISLTAQKIKIKKKAKEKPGDIIILHMCTKNYDQMMYGSWDMVRDRYNYFLFWAIFCPFISLTAQKIKILKKKLSTWRYHHFTYMYQKLWSDDVRFLRYGAWQMLLLFMILGYFLPFYPPNSPKNKILKKWNKNPRDIINLHKCTKIYDQMMYSSWDMLHDRCNYFSFLVIFALLRP